MSRRAWLLYASIYIDDIPGVPGIGPKTAAVLVAELSGSDQTWQQLDRVTGLPVRGAARLAEKLALYREQACA